MSSSAGGKKGRKKMKTVPLNEFLGPSEGVIMVKSVSSWADEVDEVEPIVGGVTKVSLPSAPRSSMPLEIDERKSRMWRTFFRDMKVCSIKLLRENNDPNGRINGTGFVEFEDKESLIMALSMPTKMLRGRQLFIEVSDTYGDPRQRRRIIDDINKSIPGDDEDRTSGDWRMNKPSQQPRERQDSHDRRRNNYDDRYDRRDDGDRRGGDRNFRGFDNFRRDDRNFRRDGGGGGYERRGDDDRGGGGYRDNRGGGYRRDYGDRRDDRGYRQDDGRRGDSFRDRRDGGFEDRRSYRNDDGYRRNDDRRDEMSRHEEEDDSANRPRLMLEKRTAPEPVGSVARGSSSIFGQAKPVDTYKKEKEIEDRLMIKKTAEPAPRPQRPSSSSIFGDAKPVDTSEK
ncbi:EIF4B [Lepeophtheirus salmonis]|uniref:EIF4B n=1 Tax=Lepeophtheirus salmonis TaxID=72036 RepID=A0A7R8HBI1_LEPSM|nr:EIF4B [Lepeophtheirus salmonis]CAF2995013.1 EIF4B [Lepeophtheirus salmonis]